MPSSFFPPRAERDVRSEIVASAPFPLALTYARLHQVLDAQDPVAGAWTMRDALECCVQFAATLAVADALHAPVVDDLPPRLAETLLNPRGLSLGHWKKLLEDALHPLEPLARSGQLGVSGRHLPFLFGLVFEVRGRRRRPSALSRKMWGNESDVVTWRNQVFGHGVFHHDPESLVFAKWRE